MEPLCVFCDRCELIMPNKNEQILENNTDKILCDLCTEFYHTCVKCQFSIMFRLYY